MTVNRRIRRSERSKLSETGASLEKNKTHSAGVLLPAIATSLRINSCCADVVVEQKRCRGRDAKADGASCGCGVAMRRISASPTNSPRTVRGNYSSIGVNSCLLAQIVVITKNIKRRMSKYSERYQCQQRKQRISLTILSGIKFQCSGNG